MNLTKDEYILNRLSKIRHKKWELFVITRIVHRLNDPDIEFVCQQPIKHKTKSKPYLADLYFPQFGIYLEIDEAQHAGEKHQDQDIQRSRDILDASGLEEHRISVFKGNGSKMRSLSSIAVDADDFVDLIAKKKAAQVANGEFEPWDYEKKFCSTPHLERGYISLETNTVFKYQSDALRCFGYSGGHFQRGAWTLKSDNTRAVWFPRLYETSVWDNSLSSDGKTIIEKQKTKNGGVPKSRKKDWSSRIVFARYKDELGSVLYRFVGEFTLDSDRSDATTRVFDRISDQVNTIK